MNRSELIQARARIQAQHRAGQVAAAQVIIRAQGRGEVEALIAQSERVRLSAAARIRS